MTTQTRERNYRKHPHTASFLRTFHDANGAAYNRGAYVMPDEAPATREARCLECDGFHPGGASCAPEEDLLALVPEAVDRRTAGQISFMDDLIADIAKLDATLGAQAADYTERMTANSAWTVGREGNASRWIDNMKAKRAELRRAGRQDKPVSVAIEDGIYFLEGSIYKVVHAIHGSGRQYAKILTPPLAEGENGTWDMAPGVVSKLRPEHRMDLEAAKKYGALYGCCVRCGRGLTKESSIEQAMGDICASKF